MRLASKLMFAGFGVAVAALAVASWDVARGRSPETASPLVREALAAADHRTCTRDAAALLAAHVPPGMAAADAAHVLRAARIDLPRTWFWTPRRDEVLTVSDAAIDFTRTLRVSPFGNQVLRGRVDLADGRVIGLEARMICAFG